MVDSWIILQVKIPDILFISLLWNKTHCGDPTDALIFCSTAIIIELVSVAKLQDNSKQYEMKLVRLL